jgi:hypothetical protein
MGGGKKGNFEAVKMWGKRGKLEHNEYFGLNIIM